MAFKMHYTATKKFALSVDEYSRSADYNGLLQNVFKQRPFSSILLLQRQKDYEDIHHQAFYQFDIPKVIISQEQTFAFKDFYNSEMLVIFIMSQGLDFEMMQTAADTMNYMRQSRILMVAENIMDENNFKKEFLLVCQSLKMTNVFLVFSLEPKEKLAEYFTLNPYPVYHLRKWLNKDITFFPDHWRNMHNKSLKTFVDQSSKGNLVFKDLKGNIQITGYVANLILLFAQYYNASLSMLYPLVVGDKLHFDVVHQMVLDNLLDVPIAMTPMARTLTRNATDFYEINQLIMMVPLSQRLTVHEIYGVLMNGYFFAYVLLGSLLLSIVHWLIHYMGYGASDGLDMLFNSKVLPGILGLSFSSPPHPAISMKIVYLLLGFVGLYTTTLFGATNKTLFTTYPSHGEIQTFQDLMHTSLELLAVEQDVIHFYQMTEGAPKVRIKLGNVSYVQEQRTKLNPAFCYSSTSTFYDTLRRQQQFWSRPTFYAPKDMVLLSLLPWSFPLQFNSPYLQPLNYLIHRVHAAGLVQAWRNSLFYDLLKLKEISIKDRNPLPGPRVLKVDDLFWVWMIMVIGLAASTLVLVFELCHARQSRLWVSGT
ncbi:uncharacterized protein LOC106087527 [Stomoxys calcitrans]|uniref:uncharacterized protein LOC106087527 n=1 Tax=Stomoxys calcitrans TaxID=35570 RepID=UPI0027E32BB4|nr:uncharacterized protein LOC106087527 [Stomoxys calcitrans]